MPFAKKGAKHSNTKRGAGRVGKTLKDHKNTIHNTSLNHWNFLLRQHLNLITLRFEGNFLAAHRGCNLLGWNHSEHGRAAPSLAGRLLSMFFAFAKGFVFKNLPVTNGCSNYFVGVWCQSCLV